MWRLDIQWYFHLQIMWVFSGIISSSLEIAFSGVAKMQNVSVIQIFLFQTVQMKLINYARKEFYKNEVQKEIRQGSPG